MAEGYEAIVRAGTLIAEPKEAPGGVIPYAVVPSDARVQNLEDFLPRPVRARAKVTANSAATFSDYVNRFKSEPSAIFADAESFSLVGILDYHAPDEAAFREHRVAYIAPRSLEWKTWRGASGKKMTQAEFAQFIEDNVVDIRTPAGAEVLEVSRNLQAKKKVEFSSAVRLADGAQQFGYAETVDGTTAKGTIKVPEEFSLGIPVFLGGELYEVRARLRYRIDGGNLQLWYELYRPEYIERDAFSAICEAVNAATGIVIWEGTP